jgi:hypothetical protein
MCVVCAVVRASCVVSCGVRVCVCVAVPERTPVVLAVVLLLSSLAMPKSMSLICFMVSTRMFSGFFTQHTGTLHGVRTCSACVAACVPSVRQEL